MLIACASRAAAFRWPRARAPSPPGGRVPAAWSSGAGERPAGTRIVLALPTPSGSSAIAGAPRATGTRPVGGFAVRAAVLIAVFQVALVAVLHLGWLSAPAYALVAVLLPSAAVGWLAQSHARLLRRLRRAMRQFEAGAPDEGATGACGTGRVARSRRSPGAVARADARARGGVEGGTQGRPARGARKAAGGAASESRPAHRPRRKLGMGARHESRRLLGRAPAHAGHRHGAPRRDARHAASARPRGRPPRFPPLARQPRPRHGPPPASTRGSGPATGSSCRCA